MSKQERQARIREILACNEIHSQEQLQAILDAESVTTTQATVSRDLRDIGAVRGDRGYVIPNGGTAASGGGTRAAACQRALRRSLHDVIADARRSGTLVVIKTKPGQAQRVAHEIGGRGLPEVLGTIAGHDTVFAATETGGQAAGLVRLLRKLAR